MSKHPMSWSVIPLGQEIEVKKGKKPIFLHGAPNEDLVPYVDIKAFEKLIIRQYADQNSGVIAEANDTLMVWDGARSGLVGNGIAGVIGSTLMRIRPKSSDRNYLHQFLKCKFSQINSNTKGTGIPHVSPEFLFGIDIPLAPLNEQKRIANKLDAVLARVDSCRDRLDRIPTILKRFRQSVLAAATTGKLTADWRNQLGENMSSVKVTDPYSHTVVAPDSWRKTSFGEVCDLIGGSQPPKSTFVSDESEDVVRLIQIRDYKSDKFKVFIPRKLARRFCNKTEVMIGRYGPPIFQILRGLEGAYNVALMKAEPKIEELELDYLFYWLKGETLLRYVESGSERTAGQDGIRKELLNVYPFFLPPKDEQTAIVRRVEALFAYADRLEARYTAARAQVEKLTPATLAKAFRGELVQQDPNDEPASALLERIKTQHGDQVASKPKRNRKV